MCVSRRVTASLACRYSSAAELASCSRRSRAGLSMQSPRIAARWWCHANQEADGRWHVEAHGDKIKLALYSLDCCAPALQLRTRTAVAARAAHAQDTGHTASAQSCCVDSHFRLSVRSSAWSTRHNDDQSSAGAPRHTAVTHRPYPRAQRQAEGRVTFGAHQMALCAGAVGLSAVVAAPAAVRTQGWLCCDAMLRDRNVRASICSTRSASPARSSSTASYRRSLACSKALCGGTDGPGRVSGAGLYP